MWKTKDECRVVISYTVPKTEKTSYEYSFGYFGSPFEEAIQRCYEIKQQNPNACKFKVRYCFCGGPTKTASMTPNINQLLTMKKYQDLLQKILENFQKSVDRKMQV